MVTTYNPHQTSDPAKTNLDPRESEQVVVGRAPAVAWEPEAVAHHGRLGGEGRILADFVDHVWREGTVVAQVGEHNTWWWKYELDESIVVKLSL